MECQLKKIGLYGKVTKVDEVTEQELVVKLFNSLMNFVKGK